ncbi:MAG: DegT/DnrJ/EryC1/StrS family aminotransferase [Spirochaetota bacterium]|nr:MAG: DegT/DnrJ/EryC1/StrS family aminotransferase [Spirochaetota bacterium]
MTVPAIEGGTPVRKTVLSFSPPDIHDKEMDAVRRVLQSKWITSGKECKKFESLLSKYVGSEHAVVLGSATAGLFLSLKIEGIGDDDEVITTPYTFAATANVILHAGAHPVFADIEDESFLISPEQIRKKITARTKAIIPVHYGGHPAELDAIRDIAQKHSLIVIEDAAHAIGAEYHGYKIGSGKNPTVFSFHAVKNVTTAEGGAVTTDDEAFANELRLYSLHGQTKDAYSKLQLGGWEYDIAVPGYKFNMTDIQAALGIEQLKRVDENRVKREKIAKQYSDLLNAFDFVKPPSIKEGTTHGWNLYPLLIDFSAMKIDRNRFIDALGAENISSNVHFKPVHIMSYYRKTFGYKPLDFPVAYSLFLREVSLPIYPQMNRQDINDVIEALSRILHYYKK